MNDRSALLPDRLVRLRVDNLCEAISEMSEMSGMSGMREISETMARASRKRPTSNISSIATDVIWLVKKMLSQRFSKIEMDEQQENKAEELEEKPGTSLKTVGKSEGRREDGARLSVAFGPRSPLRHMKLDSSSCL